MKIKLHPEQEKRIRQMATRSGHFDEKFYAWMINRATKVYPARFHKVERVKIDKEIRQQLDINQQRKKAAEFLVKNYSREDRYLIVLSRDLNNALEAFKKDTFKTADKREEKRWDLFFDFRTLNKRISEYGWSVKKMLQNGIDYFAVKRLVNSLFTPQELAS